MAHLDLAIHDIVQLRKPHPCGGYHWRVTRLGADIGLRCMTCDHKVMLPRATVEQRTKAHFDAEGQPKPASSKEPSSS
ncbi:MAG TPA: DUF951 domain-containing protein [Herpetosiphon sp.]|uniref:DUF951 domain-containing protein n=1 Tax=Herpetosiphon aurantiacus (strain ATCC 23779 / DSM 785 / 114-95) TaxID=316274 RepID=A9B6N2_HERA2|nr:DUF951 domain-containing protein [Herpetosiphon sp.]ABX04341.1 protein of unknown function DUF951 [Herpetosiphon aurantiacus DSM 785]HBW51945.1 DUF951 domain-containing protein [Herpetosiphon sp.]